jgi:hypothetical protein
VAETPTHGLPLPADGQTPWGSDYRAAMGIIDGELSYVRATAWVVGNTDATAISEQGVFVQADLGDLALVSPCGCLQLGADSLVYNPGDGRNRVLTVIASLTVDPVGNNQTIRCMIARNGTPEPSTTVTVRATSAGDFGSGTAAGLIEVEPGDVLTVAVANLTSTNNVVIADAGISLRG